MESPNTSSGQQSNRDAVFGTYELLESIIMLLSVSTIATAASGVNKTFNNVVKNSSAIQRLMLSSYLFEDVVDRMRGRHSSAKLLELFWGSIFIEKQNQSELIYVEDKSAPYPFGYQRYTKKESLFAPRFLSGKEDIPGITWGDQLRLCDGWSKAFKDHTYDFLGHGCLVTFKPFKEYYKDGKWEEAFLTRFEIGLYKYLNPVNGAEAEELLKVYDAANGGWKARRSRLPHGFIELWSKKGDRDSSTTKEWQHAKAYVLLGEAF